MRRATSAKARAKTCSWCAMARFITPPLGSSVLPGITRDSVIQLAQSLGIPIVETLVPREMLYIADEVFFSGTAAEVTPVRSIDRITIGAGRRGPITEKIQSEFFGIVEGKKPDVHRLADAGGAAGGRALNNRVGPKKGGTPDACTPPLEMESEENSRGNRLAATSPETDTPAGSAQKSVNVCTRRRRLARAYRPFSTVVFLLLSEVSDSATVGMLCINHVSMKCQRAQRDYPASGRS